MSNLKETILNPIFKGNPITVLILGICSSLAVTVELKGALIMGLSVTIVTAISSFVCSIIRKTIPNRARIIVQLVVVSLMVIVVDQVLKAYAFSVSKQLSVYIGLIITNCIVMGRIEAYALGNKPIPSLLDGAANGLGYAMTLIVVAFIRELFGSGTLFGIPVLKAIGSEQLEINFGAGPAREGAMRGRDQIRGTSIVRTIIKIRDEALSHLSDESQSALKGVNVVVGSTDVHEFGKEVVKSVLAEAGANVFDMGTSASIPEIVDTVTESGSDIVCMSTYNGMAYSFGKALVDALKAAGRDDVAVLMGGRLNEALDGSDVPVDVRDRLISLGINVDNDINTMVGTILKISEKGKQAEQQEQEVTK